MRGACDTPRHHVSAKDPNDDAPASMSHAVRAPSSTRGPLIAIGGAEDKVGDRAILRMVTERAGGKKAKIAIFPIMYHAGFSSRSMWYSPV